MCQETPRDARYTHPASVENWDNTKHPGIKPDACICKKCMKRLKAQAAQQHQQPQATTTTEAATAAASKSTEPAEIASTEAMELQSSPTPDQHGQGNAVQVCSVAGCDLPRHAAVSMTAAELQAALQEKIPDMSTLCLCNKHNMQLHDMARPTCAMCSTRIVGTKRKCPNVGALQHQLNVAHGISISGDSTLCLTCYKVQLELVDADGESRSTDHQLQVLLQSLRKETPSASRCEAALISTAIFVGQTLFENRALLLATAADHHSALTDGEAEMNNRWLLSSLQAKLGTHLQHGSFGGRKQGTLLYRTGCDMASCLFKSLATARAETLKNGRTQQNAEELCSKTTFSSTTDALESVPRLHDLMKEQAARFKHREHADPTSLSAMQLEAVITEINPGLWRNVWLMVYGNEEGGKQNCPAKSPYQHVKRVRCLFILSCMMHAVVPSCTFPFHLALSDFVEAHSKSTELMRVLSRVGATAGIDTYKRYQKTIIDKNSEAGVNANIPFAKFSIATIDNIDKNEPGKRMYCGDQSRGFHGTSIQSVTPKPLTGDITCCSNERPAPHQGFHCFSQHAEPLAKRGRSRSRTAVEQKNPAKVHQGMPCLPETQCDDALQCVQESAVIGDCDQSTSCSAGNTENPEDTAAVSYHQETTAPAELPVINLQPPVTITVNPTSSPPDILPPAMSAKWFNRNKLTMEAFIPTNEDTGVLRSFSKLHHEFLATDGHTSLKGHFKSTFPSRPEQSKVLYLGVTSDPADSKDTMLNALRCLQALYGVGRMLTHLVVVGDGKTYDHLLSLIREYGDELAWLVPFPGDWHLLKAIHPVLMRVYWDAGLKSMAVAMGYRGDLLSVLEKATNFRKCHEFLLLAHEAIGRTMLQRCGNPSATYDQLQEFATAMAERDDTWRFWVDFYFQHMTSYIGLWVAVRTGNWDLRVAAIKAAAPLFHAFDRTYYLRLLPHHLAHVASMPGEIKAQFQSGSFSVSLSSNAFSSVGLDECHEMCINKDLKAAIVHPRPEYIDRLARYLPHRGHVLHNFQDELFPEFAQEDRNRRDHSAAAVTKQQKERLENLKSIMAIMEKHSLLPLPTATGRGLVNVFSGTTATEEQRRDMLQFYTIGTADYKAYVECRIMHLPSANPPRRQQRLRTFAPATKKKRTTNQKEKNDKVRTTCLKRRIAWSQLHGLAASGTSS